MSTIVDAYRQRSVFDRIGIAVTASVLIAFCCLALYGMMTGFTATKSYEQANIWVGGGCAMLCALCGLYLMVEIVPPANMKLALFALAICCGAGYYSTIAGLPAIAAERDGLRGEVIFDVTGTSMPWTRSCNFAVVATNPDYADLRFCADTLKPRPQVGDRIKLTGFVSAWGVKAETTTVLR